MKELANKFGYTYYYHRKDDIINPHEKSRCPYKCQVEYFIALFPNKLSLFIEYSIWTIQKEVY